jgi:hypothetical protein
MSTTTKFTTKEIANDPEWARPPKLGQSIEGLARSYVYELIKDGSIKSVSLRKQNQSRGVRLIHLPSLRKFIADFNNDQNG